MTRLTLSPGAVAVLDDVAVEYLATNVRANYPGRAMYGATCLAVICRDAGELVRFFLALHERLDDLVESDDEDDVEAADQLSQLIGLVRDGAVGTRQDGMGHDVAYYWPGVVFER